MSHTSGSRLPLRQKLIVGFGSLLQLSLALGVRSLLTQARLNVDVERLQSDERVTLDLFVAVEGLLRR